MGKTGNSSIFVSFEGYNWHRYHTGFCAGFGMEIGGRFSFVFEAMYHQKGNLIKFDDIISFTKSSIVIHEFSIPLLLKVNFLRKSGPYIIAGGEFGLIISAMNYEEFYYDAGVYEHDIIYEKDKENISENLNRINYGLIFGAGMKFDLRGIGIFTEIRYHHGLAGIIKKENRINPKDRTTTNAIVFILGITI